MGSALNGLSVFLTLVDAAEYAGIVGPGQPEITEIPDPYYFLAEDGSVFTLHPGNLLWSPYRNYVAGPKAGTIEYITQEEADAYVKRAEALYGRYVPGGWFSGPRFIPGSKRATLPIYDRWHREVGYIDEEGVHYLSEREWGPIIA